MDWWKRRRASKLDDKRHLNAHLDLPDITRSTLVFPAERYAASVRDSLPKFQDEGKFRVEFIGNWWIDGNPYKGLNVVLIPTVEPRWKYAVAKFLWTRGLPTLGFPLPIKSEVQFHTEESYELARANHDQYKVFRDRNQPLALRQQAFDEMSTSFAQISNPRGVESIGTPIAKSRPTPDPEESFVNAIQNIAEETGGTPIPMTPDYPLGLQALLDQAREACAQQPNLALLFFDQVVREFDQCFDLWSQRGVAIALINSGELLTHLERYTEAIAMFERAIEKAGSDEDLELEALNAASLRDIAKGFLQQQR